MKQHWQIRIPIILVSLAACCGGTAQEARQDAGWPCFRGKGGMSRADVELPAELGEDTNLAWKQELPGKGPSGPIVVGNRVFVTCSAGDQQDQLFVVCLNHETGQKIWQRRFWATGRCNCHPLSANAAPTPVSDGERVYAFFSSNDLICLDLDGNVLWARGLAVDQPKAFNDAGMASSPAAGFGVVVCQVESQGAAFVVAMDAKTGVNLWKLDRTNEPGWASPMIFQMGEGTEPVVWVQSSDRVSVVNLKTGALIWESEGRTGTVASAVIQDNRVFFPRSGTTAVEFNSAGQFNELWSSSRVAANSSSAVVDGNQIYTLGRGGVLNCANASSGEPIWKARVGGNYWSTPVVANQRMYLFSQEGVVSVVDLSDDRGDDEQRTISTYEFEGEVFLGSPAISGNAILMRSDKYLYKFAADKPRT